MYEYPNMWCSNSGNTVPNNLLAFCISRAGTDSNWNTFIQIFKKEKSAEQVWREEIVELVYSVALTLAFESIIFFLFGYRKKSFWIVFLLINIMTNLFINLTVVFSSVFFSRTVIILILYILEISAIFVEYYIFTKIEGKSLKLFLCTFLSNVLSYSLGLLIFGHI